MSLRRGASRRRALGCGSLLKCFSRGGRGGQCEPSELSTRTDLRRLSLAYG